MSLTCVKRLLAAALVSTTTGPLSAQARGDVGGVGEIVVLGRLQGCPESTGGAASAVRIVRGGTVRLVQPGARETVRLDDAFFVERHTDVRLLIASSEYGRGAFTLAPQILCSVRGAYRAFRPYGLVDTAAYTITRAPDGALQFGVNAGGALVRWFRDEAAPKPLLVVAGGRPVQVVGTEFAIAADPAANRALVYVREGVVRFPEIANAVARAGQLYELTLRPLGAQPLSQNRPDLVRTAAQDADFHRGMLPLDMPPIPAAPPRHRSLLARPLTYVVVSVIAGAGYCGLVSDTKCGLKKPAQRVYGLVSVEIPL